MAGAMLRIDDISYSIAGRPLFEHASAAIPYGHFSTPNGTERMGKTLDLYEAWMPAMGVAQWAREVYECPPDQDNAEAFHLANAESAKAYRKSLHKLAQQVEIEDSNQ